MIQRDLSEFERAKRVGFSESQFETAIEALDDTAEDNLFGSKTRARVLTKTPNASAPRIPEDENTSAPREIEGSRRERRESEGLEHERTIHWRDINRIAFVAAAAGALWFLRAGPTPFFTGIGVLCALVGGYPILREAIENILERRMTMELSMAIAILAALAIREVFTALVITLFVLVVGNAGEPCPVLLSQKTRWHESGVFKDQLAVRQ